MSVEPLFCVGSPGRLTSAVCLKCDCWGEGINVDRIHKSLVLCGINPDTNSRAMGFPPFALTGSSLLPTARGLFLAYLSCILILSFTMFLIV